MKAKKVKKNVEVDLAGWEKVKQKKLRNQQIQQKLYDGEKK